MEHIELIHITNNWPKFELQVEKTCSVFKELAGVIVFHWVRNDRKILNQSDRNCNRPW